MTRVINFFPNNPSQKKITISPDNQRVCPSCDLKTLKGMPGGRDAVCDNCGYKDPCCYD